MGCVYRATNEINGKIYIGMTTKTLEYRRKKHIEKNKNNQTHFKRALRKYGNDNFTWQILFSSKKKKELIDKEIFYIKKYDTFNNGYNMTLGGEGLFGFSFNEESKMKMSETHKKRAAADPEYSERSRRILKKMWKNEEYAKKMKKGFSERLKRQWKDEEYRKSQTERMIGGRNPVAVKIIRLEDFKIFTSITEAANELSLSESTIRGALNVPTRTAGGFKWIKLSDYNNGSFMKKFIKNMNKKREINCSKKVRCIDTGKEYDTCTAAAREYNGHRSAIVWACGIKNAKSYGMRWEFI